MNPMLKFVVLAGLLFGGMTLSEAGPSCGQLKSDAVGPIALGSNVTHVGDFPWTVLVASAGKKMVTSCVSIHPSVILCAGRSLEGLQPSDVIARADSETRTIEKIVVKGATGADFSNNFALLKLSSPFSDVSTACLPDESTKLDEENCYATGLGDYKYNDQSKGKVQLQIEARVVERGDCESRRKQIESSFSLAKDVMCAEQKSWPDTCNSKVDGVMHCPSAKNKNILYAIGVSSFIKSCAGNSRIGLYGKTRTVNDWIIATSKDLSS